MSVVEKPSTVTRRMSRGLGGFARKWLLFAIVVVLWEIATRLSESVFFPPPSKIAAAAAKLWFSGPASQVFLGDPVFD